MTSIHSTKALMPDGWHRDVRLTLSGNTIQSVEIGVAAHQQDERHAILLPGMPNLHSHAFQRGMAGLAERRGFTADSFWSWREVMYGFALTMNPDQMEAVAAQLYVEMLEAGFTRVGEFHYLHHDIDSRPYANPAEMSVRIASAANDTGIGLTLLPVFYAHSGFSGSEPNSSQRRFIHDLDGYQFLLEGAAKALSPLDRAILGIAPHSLRAATPDELAALMVMAPDGPVHIHISEQIKEVEDCLQWSGRRPVEWLLDHLPVNDRWCLIHATHMSPTETENMAKSGAIAGLCPITEANLGDGIFPAEAFLKAGGKFGVGSDSNVQIGVADELRQLEYSQRLQHQRRNVLANPGQSNGMALLSGAVEGGAAALGLKQQGLTVGAGADFITLNANNVSLVGRDDDHIIDTFIFNAGNALIDCVWSNGKKCVSDGLHYDRDRIAKQFAAVMRDLQSQI
jgi:formimidoylglutamate deiminase